MTQAAPPRDEIGADDPELPKGDRAITPVPGRLGAGKGKAIILAALIVGSGALLGLTWERDSVVEDGAREPARQIVDFEADSARPARPTLTQPGLHPPTLAKDSATIVPAIEPSVAQPAVDDSRPATRRLETASPLLVYSRQTALPATSQALRKTAPSEISSEAAEAQPSPTPSILRAGRLPNRNFLILAGTNLPCVLATALDSTIPGQVSCVTPRDVLSDNGTTVLLDRGTRVLGEHRTGVRQGERRIFVLWTRAVTPGGVVVALNSPAADALGRAGFDGDVDSRFWARFGGALVLSLVDDGAYAAFGSSTNQSARAPSDAAAVALEAHVDIAPVLRKHQGDEVSIFVAQDLDFSGVYGLRSH